jgi:AcrR family transcriptional regulator
VEPTGLRERKKQRTRSRIAGAAAELFAARGYERVTVADVARAADVSEQTVYNYFPAKENLVLDQDEALRERLVRLVRDRPPGVSPAAALRAEALAFVDGIAPLPVEQVRGGLGSLAAVSPAIRRLSLEMTDRHAAAIAAAIMPGAPAANPLLVRVQATALAWVFQTITDETGRRCRAGQAPAAIAAELKPLIAAIINDLDRWLASA